MYTQSSLGHLGIQLTQEINPFIAISIAIQVVFVAIVCTGQAAVRPLQSFLIFLDVCIS